MIGSSTLSFLKALTINPRTTGAILPSSKYLARTMVGYIDKKYRDSLIVELGAGTGAITKEIIASGIPQEQIIAVEYVPHLAKKLHKRFPNIKIIEDCATNLHFYFKKQQSHTIISGLPLRSLDKKTKNSILSMIPKILPKNGRFIQFTYDIRHNNKSYYPNNYMLKASKIVWKNIPPAKVEVFTFSSKETQFK